jgi:DNA repair exonuclease SbcCD ATPase subunit
MRAGPYPTAKRSQYRIPAFYWRGGDSLREREHLAEEHRKALAAYRRASSELRQIEDELSHASEKLQEREGFTAVLANYIDSDVEGREIEQEYKVRLTQIEAEIKEVEAELQQARSVHAPGIVSLLQKERAYLLIQVQRSETALELASAEEVHTKRRMAEIAIDPKYRASRDLETKLQLLSRKYQHLRNSLTEYKKGFDMLRPFPICRTEDGVVERAAYASVIDTRCLFARAQEKAMGRSGKWNHETERLFEELEILNDRMIDLGMPESSLVDIAAVRSQIEGTSDGPNDQSDASET